MSSRIAECVLGVTGSNDDDEPTYYQLPVKRTPSGSRVCVLNRELKERRRRRQRQRRKAIIHNVLDGREGGGGVHHVYLAQVIDSHLFCGVHVEYFIYNLDLCIVIPSTKCPQLKNNENIQSNEKVDIDSEQSPFC